MGIEVSREFTEVGKLLDGYRPELHYMRGPGPRWHEKRIAAEQARGVHAECEILGDALLGIGLERVAGAEFVPFALHGGVVAKNRGHRKR